MSVKAKDRFINKVLGKFSDQITNREVLENIADDITDRVFLMIKNVKELKKEYDALVNSGTNKHGLNSILGKKIPARFNLKNEGRCKHPQSTLIRSYERHKIK